MPAAFSLNLRQLVVRALDQGYSSREVAGLYGVSSSFVRKLGQRWERDGTLEPLPHGGGRRAHVDERGELLIRTLVLLTPEATLAELCEDYAVLSTGSPISVPTMHRALKRLGLRRRR